ncbi:hypothetical protein [Armatimonas sp.]|uniref:hypothetical protein n=1 Tax=Armatimonas sp. TaxID=1872638 RepID=UPI00286B8F35|nr:hypothetical protein [Armatimonas sp.]
MRVELIETQAQNELATLNIIRTATALTRFPVHQLCKRRNEAIEIKVVSEAGELTLLWKVGYNEMGGPPGPLAYRLDTIVINRQIEERPNSASPVVRLGSIREICTQLGIDSDSGKNYKEVKNALMQNALTAIYAKVSYRAKDRTKKLFEFATTRYGVIFKGDELPGGQRADAVYIVINPVYNELLSKAETRPLDYAYLKFLKSPVSQRFYELVSFQIFGALENGRPRAKYLYSQFCREVPQKRYLQGNRMRMQMKEVHSPHLESGYLEAIEFVQIYDAEGVVDWEMLYTPGPRAKNEHRATRKETKQLLLSYEEESQPQKAKRGRPAKNQANVADAATQAKPVSLGGADPTLVQQLITAGLNQADAERFAREKAEQARHQLDYLPYKSNLESPGAYLRAAIEGGYAPPKEYAQAKRKEDQARKKREESERKQAAEALKLAQEAAEAARVDESLEQLEKTQPEAFTAFSAYVVKQRTVLENRYHSMSPTIRTKMLAHLESQEKRRELYETWLKLNEQDEK